MVFLLIVIVLIQTAGASLVVWFFLRREQRLEARITALYDRLLVREGVKPLVTVEHEKILKVPDPDATPMMSPADEAIYLDDVLEDLQHFQDIGHGMTPEQARVAFPQEWARAKQNYDKQHAPLKVL